MRARDASLASLASLAFVVVTATLCAAAPAFAFLCTRAGSDGPSLAWTERTVVMQRHGDGAEVDVAAFEAAILESMAPWNAIACSDVELVLGAETEDRLAGFDWAAGTGSPDNHNVIVFRNDDAGDPIDEWVHQLGALAITTVTFESDEGRLLDADIEINDASFFFTTCDPGDAGCIVEHDLQNTLTHELGHVLGLDHSELGEATMAPSASTGDTSKRTLELDDEEPICVTYPENGVTGECFNVQRRAPPDVRFEPTLCSAGGSAGGSSAWLLGLMALALRLQRGRRPR